MPTPGRNRLLWGGRSPLLTSLVSHWSLEAASGTRNDDYGTNHLTDNNTVTQAAGKVGNAGQFTAANSEYLSCASNASLVTGDIDFTVLAWVWFDTVQNFGEIVAKGNAQDFELRRSSTTNNASFAVEASSTATTDTPLTLGAWYLLLGWHNSTANTLNIQVNNGTVFSTSFTHSGATSAAEFAIGRRTTGLYHDGRIDQVAFWKRLLTVAEKTFLYNAGAGRSWTDILAYRG